MKRTAAFMLMLIILLSFSGCGVKFMKQSGDQAGYDLQTGPQGGLGQANLAILLPEAETEEIADCYRICQTFCSNNNVVFSCYKAGGSGDTADLIRGIADDGYTTLVIPCSEFASAVAETAKELSGVRFIALDISAGDLGEGYVLPDNLCCVNFREELGGFLAGYAATALGHSHLGFAGSRNDTIVRRWGAGFVQGVDAACSELGKTAEIEYIYAGTQTADNSVQSVLSGWYSDLGVEMIFACGGNMALAAAGSIDDKGLVLAEGMNKNNDMEKVRKNCAFGSVVKDRRTAIASVLLDTFTRDAWDSCGGSEKDLGIAPDNGNQSSFLRLVCKSEPWTEEFTEEDYDAVVLRLCDGDLQVADSVDGLIFSAVTVNYYDNIK